MFLWMPSPLLSGGPLLSLLFSTWIRHCHRFFVIIRIVESVCVQKINLYNNMNSVLIFTN